MDQATTGRQTSRTYYIHPSARAICRQAIYILWLVIFLSNFFLFFCDKLLSSVDGLAADFD